jgi:predicted nucleic acid-binding protein
VSTPVVVDASIAIKWVMAEAGSDAAGELLIRARSGDLALIAPEHLLGEVGNGLRKRVAQKVLTPGDAVDALDMIYDIGLEFVTGADRWVRTLEDALTWGVTTYDALYIAVALDVDGRLVTADRRLVTSARAASLPVHELGADPLAPPPLPEPRTEA